MQMSFGLYDIGEKVIVKVEQQDWAEGATPIESSATIMPRGFIPPLDKLCSWQDVDGMRYLRYVNPGKGPLYMPGIILCKRLNRDITLQQAVLRGGRVEYCVHVPQLIGNQSPDGRDKHLLELARTTDTSPLALVGCSKHHSIDSMLCNECCGSGRMTSGGQVVEDQDAGRKFMLQLGYVCTIRAFAE